MCEPTPQKIPKYATACWLSRIECVKRILEQWEELILAFSLDKDECYIADQLYKYNLMKPDTKAYFIFL